MTSKLPPDARVTGAGRAKALSPFASVKRDQSSPISASIRALVRDPSPGRLERISGGIELSEQGDGLTAHGLLDLWELAHLRGAHGVSEPLGFRVDAALAAGFLQQRAQLGAGELGRLFGGPCLSSPSPRQGTRIMSGHSSRTARADDVSTRGGRRRRRPRPRIGRWMALAASVVVPGTVAAGGWMYLLDLHDPWLRRPRGLAPGRRSGTAPLAVGDRQRHAA